MKLVIAGASGFVATEIIKQSLLNPKITSVVALARRNISVPSIANAKGDSSDITNKFKSVKIEDYDTYSEDVKQQLAGADACIWTVAVTPMKSKNYTSEQLRKINHENTMIGLKTIYEASKSRDQSTPFRFIYMSGIAAERDQTKKPDFMPEYSLLRGLTETTILDYAAQQSGAMQAAAAKPGLITRPGDIFKNVFAGAIKLVKGVPSIYVTEIAAAMIDQVVNGFEKEPLVNDDLARIGREVLAREGK